MVRYIVGENFVDPNGKVLGSVKQADKPTSPFASLPAATQKALETAGITTVEGAKALGKDGLVALEGIGDKGAEAVLAL
jgi:hypothetical protein